MRFALKKDADDPAPAFVDDACDRPAHFFADIGRHRLDLSRKTFVDEVFKRLAKNVRIPYLIRMFLVIGKNFPDEILSLLDKMEK